MKSNVTSKTIKIFSTNAAGLGSGKVNSLRSEVMATTSNIVTIQETHSLRKGLIKMPVGFVTFEAIRKAKHGGTMCTIHEDLNPKLIEEYSDPFEMLVVEVETDINSIRIITGCGPQENWDETRRMSFFIALEAEIVKAELAGKSTIIQMDSNSKLGNEYIPNDPHPMSPNGKILAAVIERHALVVANGSEQCSGLITRQRSTKIRTEKSCIDIILFSSDLKKQFKSLVIDEERKHVLTSIKQTKNGPVKKESDHNVLIAEFVCKINESDKKHKSEVYNLKNLECQKKFKKYTSNTKMLSSIFDSKDDINILVRRFMKKVDGCIKINFNKVRTNKAKASSVEKLYDKMSILKQKDDDKSKEELAKVIKEIAYEEENKYTLLMTELNKLNTDNDSRIDAQKFWKINKKIFPKSRDPPVAILDKHGNLVTTDKAIENRVLEVYSERLAPNEIRKDLKSYEKLVNKLCEARLKQTETNKTEAWTMGDLEEAVKHLDNNKSRDAHGLANELFKEEVAGTDLKLAVLKLMNTIKKTQKYPEAFELCNVTSIYKHKGSHKDMNNYRGVFRVSVLRSILDRLIYNDSYYTIDENITDQNVGARKNRNIRDNIFVLGAVVNSVINGKQDPIQIQVGDVEKCFDKLWLQKTTNELYEAGMTNNQLNLLFIENRNAKVAIKVNNQITRRVNMSDLELQGSVWGSLKCTVSMDKVNKVMLAEDDLTYHYRGDTDIKLGVLGMIDDTLAISKCGTAAIQKNAVLNSFIETQRLTMSKSKSVVLHIGRQSKCSTPCPTLRVHDNEMKTADTVRYLGDIVSASGALRPCIDDRRNKGWAKVAEIEATLSAMPDGRKVEVGLKLRETKLSNGMLYSTEAWTNIPDKEVERLEQVDMAALRTIIGGGHSRCPKPFYYLEYGLVMFRHIIMMKRISFHYHIFTREDSEIVKKIYMKQKESHLKGDWIQTLRKDYEFIGENLEDMEKYIERTSKDIFIQSMKSRVYKAAFQSYLRMKETCKKKMNKLSYEVFQMQPYLSSTQFTNEEKQLLFSLRSNCYPAKNNFKKMNKGNLNCIMNCHQVETQSHIFEHCQPVISKLNLAQTMDLNKIYGSLLEQKSAVEIFSKIDKMRKQIIKNLLPGEEPARTQDN